MRTLTSERKEITIGFDIDDCLNNLVDSAQEYRYRNTHMYHRLPESYRTCLLNQIKQEFFGSKEGERIHHCNIKLRLFTNRKDQTSDLSNARDNHTESAAHILEEMYHIIKTWIDDETCSITVDRQLFCEQVFESPRTITDYNRCLEEISPTQDERSPLTMYHGGYRVKGKTSNKRPCGHAKIDLLMHILWTTPRTKPHTVIICDDRFAPDHPDSLSNLIQFMSDNPGFIPCNISLKFFQLDPYTDLKRFSDYAYTHYTKTLFMKQNPEWEETDEHFTHQYNQFWNENHHLWRENQDFIEHFIRATHKDDQKKLEKEHKSTALEQQSQCDMSNSLFFENLNKKLKKTGIETSTDSQTTALDVKITSCTTDTPCKPTDQSKAHVTKIENNPHDNGAEVHGTKQITIQSHLSTFQQALALRCEIKGESRLETAFTKKNCWSHFLIPVGVAYIEYLAATKTHHKKTQIISDNANDTAKNDTPCLTAMHKGSNRP